MKTAANLILMNGAKHLMRPSRENLPLAPSNLTILLKQSFVHNMMVLVNMKTATKKRSK